MPSPLSHASSVPANAAIRVFFSTRGTAATWLVSVMREKTPNVTTMTSSIPKVIVAERSSAAASPASVALARELMTSVDRELARSTRTPTGAARKRKATIPAALSRPIWAVDAPSTDTAMTSVANPKIDRPPASRAFDATRLRRAERRRSLFISGLSGWPPCVAGDFLAREGSEPVGACKLSTVP